MYAPIFSLIYIYIYSSIFIYIPIYACTFLQTIPRISKVLSCPFAGLGDVGSEVETLHDDKQSWFSSWIASYCAVRRHVGEKKTRPQQDRRAISITANARKKNQFSTKEFIWIHMTHSVFTGVHECMKTQMYTDQQETIRTHGGCHAQVNQATESPCPAIRQQVRTFHHVMSKKCHPGCDADPGARSQSTDLFVFDGFDCLCMIESACTCVYICIFVYI